MKENNGIIAGFLMALFPGAMRLFSLIPRHYFFIFAIVAFLFSVLLFFLRKRFKMGWVYCLPVMVISLLIGLFLYPEVDDETMEDVSVNIIDDFPQDILDKAEAGDLKAQEEVVRIWMSSAMKIMAMASKEIVNYKISAGGCLDMIRKYASRLAENDVPIGYVASGFMKRNGLGGERLVNQAVSDYMRALELDNLQLRGYWTFLDPDSLEISNPDLDDKYRRLYTERKEEALDSYAGFYMEFWNLMQSDEVSTEEILEYFDKNSDDIHYYADRRQDCLESIFRVLIRRGCLDRIGEFADYAKGNRELNYFSVLTHLPEWELSRISTDIDSLISMSSDPMLSFLLEQSEQVNLDVYAQATLDKELAYRRFLKGEITSEEYKAESLGIERNVVDERNRISPIIGRRLPQLDKVTVLSFKVEKKTDPGSDCIYKFSYFPVLSHLIYNLDGSD